MIHKMPCAYGTLSVASGPIYILLMYPMNPFRCIVTVGHNATVFIYNRYRQSEKKRRNCDWRVICNATRCIGAGRGVVCHWGVSDGSDGARPLWQSHSGRTEMYFADEQNVQWFGRHNWTTPQLWTAILMLPDAPRFSQIGWMQSDVLSGALWLLLWCSSILQRLWNRKQEYPEEFIVVFKMRPN